MAAGGNRSARYLEFVKRTVVDRWIDVVLPTHEQAWLFAAAAPLLPRGTPVAVADIDACERVQGKIVFARLLDELRLPQPHWQLAGAERDLKGVPFPYWLKAAFSTAGVGVRHVTDHRSRRAAVDSLLVGASTPVMVQQPAPGPCGQAQGLFDRGRLVAAHTSVRVGTGIGPSAAARLSVDHPAARNDLAVLGEALGWDGGLTLDYMHEDGAVQYIECNPRTVEPGNAAAAGVNIAELQVRLTCGEELPSPPLVGTAGVRTHGTIALLL